MMESFWGTMQLGLLDSKAWQAREELANAIFGWIETSHQPKLSSRGWVIGRGRTGAEGLVGVVGLGRPGALRAPRPRGWVEVGGVHRSRSSAPPMLSSIQPYGAPPGV